MSTGVVPRTDACIFVDGFTVYDAMDDAKPEFKLSIIGGSLIEKLRRNQHLYGISLSRRNMICEDTSPTKKQTFPFENRAKDHTGQVIFSRPLGWHCHLGGFFCSQTIHGDLGLSRMQSVEKELHDRIS